MHCLPHVESIRRSLVCQRPEEIAFILNDGGLKKAEALWITAAVCNLLDVDCQQLANEINPDWSELWSHRDQCIAYEENEFHRVTETLDDLSRLEACSLVALIGDWSVPAVQSIQKQLEKELS